MRSFTELKKAAEITGLGEGEILYECNKGNISWYQVGNIVMVDDDDVLDKVEKKQENQRAAG